MANEFVIKINRDSNGNTVSLNDMTIEAADALKVFIESLSEVAKLHRDNSEIRLSLKNGSIESVLTYPESDTEIGNEIQDIIEGNSYNSDFVKIFRNIQDKIKDNGLDYSIIHKVNNTAPADLTSIFKDKNFTLKRGTRKEWFEKVLFITGHLFESGGKNTTNIHLDSSEGDLKIECTKIQAARFELYTPVYLCVLKKWKNGGKPLYTLMDIYSTPNVFTQFENIYKKVSDGSLERFDIIHSSIVEYVNKEELSWVIKFMKLFNHSQSDRGALRTILIALKPLKTHERISEIYKELADILRAGSIRKVI